MTARPDILLHGPPQRCCVCGRDGVRHCDGPRITGTVGSIVTERGTCDEPLCLACTTVDANDRERDFCPKCSGDSVKPRGNDRLCTLPSTCRSCSATVYWVIWPDSGKRMPVDAQPVPDGNIILTHRVAVNQLWAAQAAKLDPELLKTRKRYVSHFSTCPDSKAHRKPRDGKGSAGDDQLHGTYASGGRP